MSSSSAPARPAASSPARLSEDPDVSVLLLEAGPDYPSVEQMPEDIRRAWTFGGMDHDWGYSAAGVVATTATEPRFGIETPGVVPVPRGKVVGGSSAVNGSNAMRAYRSDFDRWVGLGNDDWSWDAVLPYFRRAEDDAAGGDWHGTGGPVPIRRFTGESLRPVMRAFLDGVRAGRARRSSRISTRRVPWARGRCPSTRSTACGRARRSRISLRLAGAPTSSSGRASPSTASS